MQDGLRAGAQSHKPNTKSGSSQRHPALRSFSDIRMNFIFRIDMESSNLWINPESGPLANSP
jgi:hypothetical protein